MGANPVGRVDVVVDGVDMAARQTKRTRPERRRAWERLKAERVKSIESRECVTNQNEQNGITKGSVGGHFLVSGAMSDGAV